MKKEKGSENKKSSVLLPPKPRSNTVKPSKDTKENISEHKKGSVAIPTKKKENSLTPTNKINGQLAIEINRIENNNIPNGKTVLLPVTEREDMTTPRSVSQESKTMNAESKEKEYMKPLRKITKNFSTELTEDNIKSEVFSKTQIVSNKSVKLDSNGNAFHNNVKLMKSGTFKENHYSALTLTPKTMTPLTSAFPSQTNINLINVNALNDFIAPEAGGTMQIRVISRFRPLNNTEKVNINITL